MFRAAIVCHYVHVGVHKFICLFSWTFMVTNHYLFLCYYKMLWHISHKLYESMQGKSEPKSIFFSETRLSLDCYFCYFQLIEWDFLRSFFCSSELSSTKYILLVPVVDDALEAVAKIMPILIVFIESFP